MQGLCYDLKDGKTEELRPLLEPSLQIVNQVDIFAYAQAGFAVTFSKVGALLLPEFSCSDWTFREDVFFLSEDSLNSSQSFVMD